MGDIILFRVLGRGGKYRDGRGIWLAERVFDSTIEFHDDPAIDRDYYRDIEAAVLAGASSLRLGNGETVQWRIVHPWDIPEGKEPQFDPVNTTMPHQENLF